MSKYPKSRYYTALIPIILTMSCSAPGTRLTNNITDENKNSILSCGMYACEIKERVNFHQEKTTK